MSDLVNVKTDFGAKGDGATDDAPAIQAALNAWFGKKPIFVPAGTYALKSTLLITQGHLGYLFGAGSDKTKFVWKGPPAGSALLPMLNTNGCNFSLFVGMSFDISGPNTACVSMDYVSGGPNNVNGDTFVDIATANAQIGIILGYSGTMGSEMLLIGTKHTDHDFAGVCVVNQNALSEEVWGGTFVRCSKPTPGDTSAGNFTNRAAILCQGGSVTVVADTTFVDSGTFDIHTTGDAGCLFSHITSNNSLPNNGYYGGPSFWYIEHRTYAEHCVLNNTPDSSRILLWTDTFGSMCRDVQFGHGKFMHGGPMWFLTCSFADPDAVSGSNAPLTVLTVGDGS